MMIEHSESALCYLNEPQFCDNCKFTKSNCERVGAELVPVRAKVTAKKKLKLSSTSTNVKVQQRKQLVT